MHAADSSPGVLTTLLGQPVLAYGAHAEDRLTGPAGQVIAQRHGAVCVGTVDGAIWLTHLKAKSSEHRYDGLKLPAAQVLQPVLQYAPHVDIAIDSPVDHRTYRDIRYWERGQVGYLSFDFYNGAMSTPQCRHLENALRHARSRPTQVICLLGGRDFWSNGIHLNVIEAADDAARESWRNIIAIDDVVLQILTARQLVVAGLRGNAGAGGAMLALAADQVWARRGWCSTRTTGPWATCTDPSTGRTPCRVGWAPRGRWRSPQPASRWGWTRRATLACSTPHSDSTSTTSSVSSRHALKRWQPIQTWRAGSRQAAPPSGG